MGSKEVFNPVNVITLPFKPMIRSDKKMSKKSVDSTPGNPSLGVPSFTS